MMRSARFESIGPSREIAKGISFAWQIMIHRGRRWIMGKEYSLDLRERIIGFVEAAGRRDGLPSVWP
jgi:hypothetical protein